MTFAYLIQLLAVFFFFQFLPVPVNLNVLLVARDDLRLDFICARVSVLLLLVASLLLLIVGVALELRDSLKGLVTIQE